MSRTGNERDGQVGEEQVKRQDARRDISNLSSTSRANLMILDIDRLRELREWVLKLHGVSLIVRGKRKLDGDTGAEI
jgi:hypothetical protein